MSGYEIVVGTIKQEHRVLGHVVEVLQHSLRDIAAGHTPLDFGLLATILYYIDDFPERCHHPKEERHFFRTLRERSSEFEPVLDELEAEHVSSAHMMNHLHRALVHYQAGAPQALSELRAGVDAYAAMLSEHMRKEEHLLAQAELVLTADDWSAISVAFEADDDPLFGARPRQAFRLLRLRIRSLLPSKLRSAVPAGERSPQPGWNGTRRSQ